MKLWCLLISDKIENTCPQQHQLSEVKMYKRASISYKCKAEPLLKDASELRTPLK